MSFLGFAKPYLFCSLAKFEDNLGMREREREREREMDLEPEENIDSAKMRRGAWC